MLAGFIRLSAVALLACLGSTPALAQGAILQGGPTTDGHVPQYVGSGSGQPIVNDGGSAGGGSFGANASELGLVARGTGTPPYAGQGTGPFGSTLCSYDAPIDNATGYHFLCLSPNATGGNALISYGAGGAATPGALQFNINGAAIQFPGTATANVTGPLSSTVGHAAVWANASGTLLADAGTQVACGGVDDTAALNTAITAAAASSKIVTIPSAVCAIASSINVSGVSIVGDNSSFGYFANQGGAPYTLLLNPAATINLGSNSSLRGVRVIRQGVTQPNSLRSAITAANAFSGTAITVTNTLETELDHVTIIGFQYAIKASGDRLRLNYVAGDNTNGIQQTACGDTCKADHIEFWPFLAAPYTVSPQFQTSTISGVTNAGGLFEITLSGVPATPIVTGDIVVIGSVGGFAAGVAPNGRWTVTAIDTSHFTLNGSTFAGGYTTGGTAYLTSTRRTGKAIEVIGTGSLFVTDFTEYGWDTSWHVGGTAYGNRCYQCWFDGDLVNDPDPVPVGVLVDGTPIDTTMNGSFIADKGISIKNNITGAVGNSLTVMNTTIGATGVAAGVVGAGLQALGGQTAIGGGSQFRDVCAAPTNPYVRIGDGAASVVFSGLLEVGAAACFPLVPSFQTLATDCPKFSRDGLIGPCPWTPALAGDGTPGTPTYAANYPVGYYTVQSQNLVTAWMHYITTAQPGAAVGNMLITGLPKTNASTLDQGTCSIARMAGITLPMGYTAPVAQVSFSQNQISLSAIGSASPTLALVAGNFAAASELQIKCQYHLTF